jgi:bacillithiol system protein YtxJ
LPEIQPITGVDEWRRIWRSPRPALVFKHSTRCPISARAHDAFVRWAAGAGADAPLPCRVLVVEDRPVSDAVAADTGVAHQSPQALLVQGGRVLWHASHWAIDEAALAAAAADPATAPGRSTTLAQALRERRGGTAALP